MEPPYLMLTMHDLRTPRQGNMQFAARELAKRGQTRFFSLGYSWISRLKGDYRNELWSLSNRSQMSDGIECYLWRTLLHPGNILDKGLDSVEQKAFTAYVRQIPDIFADWVRKSNTIYIESGLSVAFFEAVKKINPSARVCYIASDDLKTIGCANYLIEEFARTAPKYDAVFALSRALCKNFPAGTRTFFVPHGLDTSELNKPTTSPYGTGLHAVSVGNMLFDASVIQIGAEACPEVTFHLIGSGPRATDISAPNVKIYGEMPWADTVRYLQHADIGIAPYNFMATPYLTDTSMKLKQYAYVGLPAVCPQNIVGTHKGRFGYEFGDGASIVKAFKAALSSGRFPSQATMTWAEHTDRLVSPESFEDCKI